MRQTDGPACPQYMQVMPEVVTLELVVVSVAAVGRGCAQHGILRVLKHQLLVQGSSSHNPGPTSHLVPVDFQLTMSLLSGGSLLMRTDVSNRGRSREGTLGAPSKLMLFLTLFCLSCTV